MRILKVIHAWPPEGRGGTEAHAAQAAQALSARGHQVGVFTRTGRPGQPEYEVTTETAGNIGITRINNTFADSWSFPWMYKNQRIHEAFEREVEEFKPDLVHIHHLTNLSTTIVEAVKSRGLPCVMTLHDFWMICPRGQRMMADLHLCEDLDRTRCYGCLGGMWPHIFDDQDSEPVIVNDRSELSPQVLAEWDRHMAYVMNLCDLLVTPSAFHRERMLEVPIAPERVISLPHGMDHAPFASQPREVGPVKRIGFIGSVIPVKGVHVLIEAFRTLGRPDIHLDIHGEIQRFHEDEGYEARLRDQARGASNIHFHGGYDAEDVPRLLAGIDILVVPSLWWETFCLTIREGLLAGIPVVASDLGAMREALDGEQDGVFFRPGDAGDLAEKLAELIDDDARRARFMNRGASVKALADYVEELEDVYASAVRLSQQREGRLVIAPPHFPKSDAPPTERKVDLGSVPWQDIGISMNQAGTAAFKVETRLPTADDPTFEVGIRVTDGDRETGRLDLEIDLAPIGDADQGAAGPAPIALEADDVPASTDDGGAGPSEHEPAPARRKKRRRKKSRSRPAASGVEDAADSSDRPRNRDSEPAAPPESEAAAPHGVEWLESPRSDSNGDARESDEEPMGKSDGSRRSKSRGPENKDEAQRERRSDRGDRRKSGGRREEDATAERGKRVAVRRVPGARPGSARRTPAPKGNGGKREDVPRGGLKTERWTVDRTAATRKVKPDES